LTGIIICDHCSVPFLAHGTESSVPDHLKGLPLFNGIRKLKAVETNRKTKTGFNRKVNTEFVDLCEKCETQERLRKR